MTTHTRRDFIRKSAGAVGAAATAMAMPASIQRALAVDAAVRTRTIRDVQHVVVLMQENRSFNHYFGTLRGVRGFGDRTTIPLESGKPVWFQSDGSRDIAPYHLDPATTSALLVPSTPHSFADAQAAWNQGKSGSWPKYKNQYSMGYYRREDIPFQFALAEAFTLCDDYHCSITTGTDPNRIVFWSGSNFDPDLRAQGIDCDDDQSEPNNLRCWPSPATWVPGAWPHSYGYVSNGFTWDTIPDVLQGARISWRIYQDMNDNWTGAMNGCLAFESFRTARPGTPLYENGLTGGPDYLERFAQDVADGTLPQVSWVLPTRASSEHPGAPSSPTHGGDFTADVLDALTANPEVWSRTVLFLTFDENDGLFDHLPAPAVPSYDADGAVAGKATLPLAGHYFRHADRKYLAADDTISGTTRPWGMGPRVPMYVVSPWSRGGWVDSQVFDHTSVGRFLEQRFGITMDTISPWHRAVSGDLTSAFDFTHPNDRRFPALPDQSHWPASDAHQRTLPAPTAPATPQPLFQEPGVRYSRALPYELHTTARVDHRSGTVELRFDNPGRQGAVFHVYDKRHLDRIPRRYTVEARRSLDDTWAVGPADGGGDAGAYDLEVFGPSGFFRSFRGRLGAGAGAGLEVGVRYEPRRRAVVLSARNDGRRAVTLTVAANAHRTDGPGGSTSDPARSGRSAGRSATAATGTTSPPRPPPHPGASSAASPAGSRPAGTASATRPWPPSSPDRAGLGRHRTASRTLRAMARPGGRGPGPGPAEGEEQLEGGIADAGHVVRAGPHVLRPAGPHTASIHAYLRAVRQAGFQGVPAPVGIDDDGRERLVFVDGDVPVPPYPDWSQTDAALASVARLLRGLHDAARGFDPRGLTWDGSLADPAGGTLVGHNDVCPENVVFRDGIAVALLDFEFAAPGRPVYDLAHLARLCVPVEDDVDQARLGWRPADRPARLRLVADAYGLDRDGRAELLGAIDAALARLEAAVRRSVDAGDPDAVALWHRTGGGERYARRRRWWTRHHDEMAAALL